jgi:hypothetical protein
MFSSLIFAFIFSTSNSHADLKPEAGLGFTNNAYLTDVDEESDFFWRVGGTYTSKQGEHTPRIRLTYTDYFQEDPNDSLGWRIADHYQPRKRLGEWSYRGSLFGRHYTQGSPGTTDLSYSHIGVDGSMEQERKLGGKALLTWGPGAEIRKYLDNNSRNDISTFISATVDFETAPDLQFGTLANVGFVFSNQSDFSRMFLEAGGNVTYNIKNEWDWFTEIVLRRTHFTGRTVTDETTTSKARGKIVSVRSVETKESYTGVTVTTELSRIMSPSSRVSGELAILQQSSESGLQDYSAVELFGRWIWNF